MIASNIRFNSVELRWRYERHARFVELYRIEDDGSRRKLAIGSENFHRDDVPEPLNRKQYTYELIKDYGGRQAIETVRTSLTDWCEDYLPMPILPGRPGWMAIYRKAWQLTWRSIVSSPALPARFGYSEYPDNDVSYLWDSCFCLLFQRYAAPQGIHPGARTLDNFYASMQDNGYIPRIFNWKTFRERFSSGPSEPGINPPLCAWAEWNYYLISADRERLERVLPILIKHHRFIDGYLAAEPGFYRWTSDGEGWDNIDWKQGERRVAWFVDLLAQQALAAKHIVLIAEAIGDKPAAATFGAYCQEAKRHLEPYWNARDNWYCSLTLEKKFTSKTLNGMWPLLAGLVTPERARQATQQVLMNPNCFNTAPMPLPALAKDEPDYNILGEYKLGGVWLNMSLVAIRALELYGLREEAMELTRRTLDGIWRVYDKYPGFPRTLWECYAPEITGPASHKVVATDQPGGVREEFAGGTCLIINLIIEHMLGISVDAPANELTWNLRLAEEHGIQRLCFGTISTTLHARARRDTRAPAVLNVQSSAPYTLVVKSETRTYRFAVSAGDNCFSIGE